MQVLAIAFGLFQPAPTSPSVTAQLHPRPPDGLGHHICPLNDLDGDGSADLALDDGGDCAWIVSGRTGSVLARHLAMNVRGLDPVRQVRLVSLQQDVDGDGKWDLLDLGNGLRQARIARSGADLGALPQNFGIARSGSLFGLEAPLIGDWNGDRANDVVGGESVAGRAQLTVRSGATGKLLQDLPARQRAVPLGCGDYDHDWRLEILLLDDLSLRDDFTREPGSANSTGPSIVLLAAGRSDPILRVEGAAPGLEEGHAFGNLDLAAAIVPDVDDDELDDILVVVTAPNGGKRGSPMGKAVIYSSATGAPQRQLDCEYAGALCDAVHVANLGDVDRDRILDFAIAYDRMWEEGRVVVFSGKTGSVIREHAGTPANLDARGRFGVAVAGMGDTNGDGVGDYLVGSSGGIDGLGAGCVTLYSGLDGEILRAIWRSDLIAKK